MAAAMVPIRSPSAAAMAAATPGEGVAAAKAGSSASSERTRSAIDVAGASVIAALPKSWHRAGLDGTRSCREGPRDPAAARDVAARLPRAADQQPARAVAVDEHPEHE